MKPENFKGQNVIMAKDQPEYLQLPAHRDKEGIITSCWKMSWLERFKAFFFGRIWVQNMTFNQLLQPQKISVERPELQP